MSIYLGESYFYQIWSLEKQEKFFNDPRVSKEEYEQNSIFFTVVTSEEHLESLVKDYGLTKEKFGFIKDLDEYHRQMRNSKRNSFVITDTAEITRLSKKAIQ